MTTVVMSFAIFFSQTFVVSAFSDIKGTVHEKDINALYEQGIVSGYADGTFKPDAYLTREQAVRLIGRMLKNELKVPEDAQQITRFEDVTAQADEELKNLSALLYEEGVFLGSQGYLDGQAPMQRQHMALVLNRFAKDFYEVNLVERAKQANFKASFTDLHGLNNEAMDAITGLQYAGISVGQQFQPSRAVTRGEFAAFLNRLFSYLDKQSVVHEEDHVQNAPAEETTNVASPELESSIEGEINLETTEDRGEEQAWEDVKAVEIQTGTSLFASRNELKQIATWEGQNVVVVADYLVEDELFVVALGTEKFYVQPPNVIAKPTFTEQSKPFVGAVRTKGAYTVWQSIGGKPLLKGTRATKLEVVGVEGNYYRVQIGGLEGYVKREETFVNPKRPLKLLDTKVVTDVTMNYSNSVLHAGAVIQANWTTDQMIHFGNGNARYVIENKAVVETDEAISFLPTVYTAYPIRLIAKEVAPILNTAQEVIGELNANTSFTLTGIGNGYGVIDYAGKSVYVPLQHFKHVDLVMPTRDLYYEEVDYYLQVLHLLYPHFTELELIGKSVEGRNIHALKLGTGEKSIVLDASLHAREHMTTNVLMEMIDQYALSFLTGGSIGSYNVHALLNEVSIWFVPMVNPDGVTLVQRGLSAIQNQQEVLRLNNGSSDFSRWKANIRGVDLNRNFDARWYGLSKRNPSWEMYQGPQPLSEPESQGLAKFLLKYPFKSYVSFHSSGQILFLAHETHSNANNKNFINAIQWTTGYQPIREKGNYGTGASTNYFVIKTGNPEVTVEIAPYAGNSTVSYKHWADVWKRTQLLGLAAASEARYR